MLCNVEFVEPDIVFSDGQLELDLGSHRAVLRSYGPAHAADDQVVLVDDRVLFTGDLVAGTGTVVVDDQPGALADYIASLDRLLAIQPRRIYPKGRRRP